MKVGILTIHRTNNFGSTLQAYGLYKTIQEKNVKCELLDYACDAIEEREIPRKHKITGPRSFYQVFFNDPVIRKKYKAMREFIEKNMVLSQTCDKNTIKELDGKYDMYLVGSDIVWGTTITNQDFTYFLDFVSDNSKKYSFASSVGEKWNKDKDIIEKLLAEFNKIAVREKQAAEWVEEFSGKQAEVVCDPTMLRPFSEWHAMAELGKDYANGKKYILVYFKDPQKKILKDALKLAKERNMQVVYINYDTPVKGMKNVLPQTIYDFLRLIRDAELVLSASYHGMLFSMYFAVPLFYYNRGWKSRMQSIAELLGIEYREGTDDNIRNNKLMDYDAIHKEIQKMRKQSMQILDSYFGGEK